MKNQTVQKSNPVLKVIVVLLFLIACGVGYFVYDSISAKATAERVKDNIALVKACEKRHQELCKRNTNRDDAKKNLSYKEREEMLTLKDAIFCMEHTPIYGDYKGIISYVFEWWNEYGPRKIPQEEMDKIREIHNKTLTNKFGVTSELQPPWDKD